MVERTPPSGCAERLLKAPDARVRAIVEQKKTVAAMAVERERKLALPVAPKTEPEAPLPNAAPVSGALAVLHQHEDDNDHGRNDLQNERDAKQEMHGERNLYGRCGNGVDGKTESERVGDYEEAGSL